MQSEVMPFANTATVDINWNTYRKQRFGLFPILQVWLVADGKISKANIPVTADAPPPATTRLTVNFGGAATGFIQIK